MKNKLLDIMLNWEDIKSKNKQLDIFFKHKTMKKPSEAIFNEMKRISIEIWNTYDNTYGYVDEKIESINALENIGDNAMIFYRMFDCENQNKFINKLSNKEIKIYISNNL